MGSAPSAPLPSAIVTILLCGLGQIASLILWCLGTLREEGSDVNECGLLRLLRQRR